ncbi:MAG: hypothetical protein C0425_10795 [Chlorobiaceae bacterium]|nr:hypothetical protein [Chlorobiaceae bacterium]MBA4310804.1 hypothetical protein [Chlorobiaceae bacterium]
MGVFCFMNAIEKKILEITEQKILVKNLMLIEITFRGNPASRVIEIYVDGEENISIESCAQLSREIIEIIETENIIDGSYRLDVSSPGIDRPLKYLKQFPKHLNRNFEISFTDLNDKTKILSGKLLEVKGEELKFLVSKNEIVLNYSQIKKAKVLISFS